MKPKNLVLAGLAAIVLAGGAGAVAQAATSKQSALPKTVTTYCDHGNRIYLSKTLSIAVVPQDQTCAQPTPTRTPATKTPSPRPTTPTPVPTFHTPVPTSPAPQLTTAPAEPGAN